jgi:hypothetical protein
MRETFLTPLRQIFSCDIANLDYKVLVHRFMTGLRMMNMSYSMLAFKYCMDVDIFPEDRRLPVCLPIITNTCLRSKIIFIKLIRLHMSLVEDLLRSDPAVRVIHLVRDPRGTLASWWRLLPLYRRHAPDLEQSKLLDADFLCRRMSTDVHILRELEVKYPGRLMLIRYEDICTDTNSVVDAVYNKFLGLRVPDGLADKLKALQNAKIEDGAYGTRRQNASLVASRWRRTLDPKLITRVTTLCSSLIRELNYTV